MYQKILVPVDGTHMSTCGLNEAIKLAKNQGAQLRLIHVANDRLWDCNDGEGTHGGNIIEPAPEDGQNILSAAATKARHHGIEGETVLVESTSGPAAGLIIAQAKEWSADLIVMGTHGRRGVRRLTMGSVAECVVRDTPVPVLLVHGIPREAVVVIKTGVPDDAAKQGTLRSSLQEVRSPALAVTKQRFLHQAASVGRGSYH
jgi:nucleotide-binding universal stress UspA family protein